jgi:hypothetical protein
MITMGGLKLVKELFIGCLLGLALLNGACAHVAPPATQIVDIPVIVQPKSVAITPCPVLPIIALTPDSDWDLRLKSWDSSISILMGCVEARDKIIGEIGK